jgi:hypothetical protein
MARTEGQWQKGISFISPSADLPILLKNSYLNFGGVNAGDLGYGLRDNDGVIEFKNDEGAWAPVGTGGAGSLSQSFETVSKNLKAFPNELTYTGENLTSIEYTTDLGTVVKTFGYTGENLTTITLSGDLPEGLVNTIKTLAYTGENLTSITYA